jgi:hypothetical protein
MAVPPPPPGFTLDQPQSSQEIPPPPAGFTLDGPPEWLRKSGELGASFLKNTQGALAEPAAQILSGMVATPVAGLVGLAQGAKNYLSGSPGMPAADRIRQVENAMTYEPRTTAGKAVSGVVSYPFEKLAQLGDWAGQKTSDFTGSPAAGATVNTAIQFAPSALFKVRGIRGGAAAESVAARGARIEPTISEPPGVAAANARPAVAPNVAAAQEYVASRTSLDWNALSDSVKARLTDIARDADTLGKLDPASVERQARLESLPVPIKATKGQITRDTAQLNNEGTLAATESGRELKAVRDAQSSALIANLDVLKGKVSGRGATAATATTPEQVGLSVQDAALRTKLKLSQENVRRLYQKAEAAGETQGTVTTRPLAKLIQETPDLQHLGWVDSWLKKADFVTDQTGAATKGLRYKASLKELEDLRQAAVARAMDGGTEGYYAGKVIRAIDEATEGAGGDAYKAARAARKQQALEFEDQAAVARLVENKSRTDRATALENTWRQTVLGGSIEDLNKVKRSLLTGPDTATRVAGRKAWNDIRAQTIQHIVDESTKSAAVLPDGSPVVSAAKMKQVFDAIGPQKLDAIFGQGTVRQLNQILKATQDLRTEPPRVHPGASTMGNIAAFLEKSLGKIPVLGNTGAGAVRAVVKLNEMGSAGRETRAAMRSPLDDASTATTNALRSKRNKNALGKAAPSFIPAAERDQ